MKKPKINKIKMITCSGFPERPSFKHSNLPLHTNQWATSPHINTRNVLDAHDIPYPMSPPAFRPTLMRPRHTANIPHQGSLMPQQQPAPGEEVLVGRWSSLSSLQWDNSEASSILFQCQNSNATALNPCFHILVYKGWHNKNPQIGCLKQQKFSFLQTEGSGVSRLGFF